MSADRRSALFVLNPASGSDDADETESAVIDRLRDDGVDVEVRRTEGEGDARRWAEEAAAAGEVDVVVVAGGDGSVREVVSGVVGVDGRVPIAVVPTGTANLLARALGVPVDDRSAAAALATTGERRAIDVIHIIDRDEHAVIMVDAGFDAQLVRDADRGRKDALGPFAYVAAGVRNLFDLDRVEVEIEVDGDVRRTQAHSVLCLNVGRIGDLVVVDHGIEPDDGRLHVAVLSEEGAADAAKAALEMIVAEQAEQARVAWADGRRIRVEATPPLQVQVDGEPAGETPFEVALLPAAVTILVPGNRT